MSKKKSKKSSEKEKVTFYPGQNLHLKAIEAGEGEFEQFIGEMASLYYFYCFIIFYYMYLFTILFSANTKKNRSCWIDV